jgi:hypothetical protein
MITLSETDTPLSGKVKCILIYLTFQKTAKDMGEFCIYILLLTNLVTANFRIVKADIKIEKDHNAVKSGNDGLKKRGWS